MKEIDTEASVVWPAWCYSGSGNTNTAKLTTHSPLTSTSSLSSSSSETVDNNGSQKPRHRRKSHFTTKQLPAAGSAAINGHLSSPRISLTELIGTKLSSPPASGSAATASPPDKMLSDRMMLGFNASSTDSTKKHCDNNSSSFLYFDKLQNETEVDALKDCETANNNNNSIISNNMNSNSTGRNSNCVKRERLSPAGNNGDGQAGLSRSRSATPSSFRGTPPQNITNADITLQNLSSNFLSTIKGRATDYPTRNYSDFMRSLAAKYNNANPNDAPTRSTFSNKSTPTKASNKKEVPTASPTEPKVQNAQNIPGAASNVSPFVTTLLSSLPFSRSVFPPLIDMSSTQALVTLARAAKEAEIQNVLRSAQKRPASSQSHSPSPHSPSLAAALQQATHFASPALLYSTQFHHQHQSHSHGARHPETSPHPDNGASIVEKTSPLDLSSAPHAKRFKVESTSSSETGSKSPAISGTPAAVGSEQLSVAASLSSTPALARMCQSQSDEVVAWTVDDVCSFVGSIDICAEYMQNFRDACIDGSGLPLLTEDHLTKSLGMKLGPALKLRSVLMKKLGGPCPCVSCTNQVQILAAQALVAASSASASSPSSMHQSETTLQLSQFSTNAKNTASSSTVNNLTRCNSNSNICIQIGNSCNVLPRPGSADSGS